MSAERRLELLYAVNPMCSWCYGFAPSIEAVREAHGPTVSITLALGALRADTEPMRPEQKTYIGDAWLRVAATSGQPFDRALLAANDFVYDTRPASRALLAARAQGAEGALTYLRAIQEAFYRDGRRVTEASVLQTIAAEVGLDGEAIGHALRDPASALQLERENRDVAALGIGGYPTVVALGTPPRVLTIGFMPAEAFEAVVAEALRAS